MGVSQNLTTMSQRYLCGQTTSETRTGRPIDCRGDINALIELRDGRLAAAAREIMIFDSPRNGDGKEKEKEDACFDLDDTERRYLHRSVERRTNRVRSKDNSIRI